MVNSNGVYDFRVTVLMEDNSQTRFGATTYGLADKLARTLVNTYPFAVKVLVSLERTGRVLISHDRVGLTPTVQRNSVLLAAWARQKHTQA